MKKNAFDFENIHIHTNIKKKIRSDFTNNRPQMQVFIFVDSDRTNGDRIPDCFGNLLAPKTFFSLGRFFIQFVFSNLIVKNQVCTEG